MCKMAHNGATLIERDKVVKGAQNENSNAIRQKAEKP